MGLRAVSAHHRRAQALKDRYEKILMRFAKEISHLYAHEHPILRRSRASDRYVCEKSIVRRPGPGRITAASRLHREDSEDVEDVEDGDMKEEEEVHEISAAARRSSAIIRGGFALVTLCDRPTFFITRSARSFGLELASHFSLPLGIDNKRLSGNFAATYYCCKAN